MPLQADIEKALLERKLVSEEQMLIARREQEFRAGLTDEILVDLGYLKEDEALKVRAEQLNVGFMDASTVSPDPKLVTMLPEDFAQRNVVMPLSVENGVMNIVMANPENFMAVEETQRLVRMTVKPVLGARGAIRKTLAEYHEYWREQMIQRLMTGVADQGLQLTRKLGLEIESLDEVAEQAPAMKAVNLLILQALQRRASDIHLEYSKSHMNVRYRVDGILHEMQQIPFALAPAVISRIKIMCKLDITEKRMPQDGSFHIKVEGREIDFRVATNPGYYGEKAVLRILDKGAVVLDLPQLGFSQRDLASIRRHITRPHGIVILTGPTGSGKTTTLYSALASLNVREKNVVTVEDPVEYQLDGITQHQVNAEIDLTFAALLRSIMRQDPDIIMIGEIRDLETAQIAIRASLTGHLVFSTLHTNDAPSAVARLLDLGADPALIASTLRCVVAQRLVRTICPKCKEPFSFSGADIEGLPPAMRKGTINSARGKGCRNCFNTGYRGRMVIAEVLEMNDEMRDMVVERRPAPIIRQAAIRAGMVGIYEDALQKMLAGSTTLEEILQHSDT
jgi:type II secretory ATPase GspE/PulE/Tfp pilus assembly ATPase PilB-like protein